MAEVHHTVEYRDIPGYTGYQVGDDGSVWSRWERGRGPSVLGNEWRRLLPTPTKHGHVCVTIRRGSDKRPRYVHRLVLEAFIGPCPPGMEGRHFPDRDPANNNLSNLSWATHTVNMGDCLVHGTHNRGSRCGTAKLTEELVRLIRAKHAAGGVTQRQLARKYGASEAAVSNLLNRKTWQHVA